MYLRAESAQFFLSPFFFPELRSYVFPWMLLATQGHNSPASTLFVSVLRVGRRRATMNEDDLIFSKNLQQKGVTRRSLIRGATGAAAGAGLMLSSGLRLPALADDGEHNNCRVLARPIPHITGPGHFFFPGPPDGSAPTTFPHFPNAG